MSSIQPVILSGGSGTRLWPLSREAYPKQFLPLAGELTMLQATWKRVAPIAARGPLVIANEEHRFVAAEQLQQVGAQHVPVVIVVLLALVAADHEAANSLVRQQCFVDGEVCQIGFDSGAFLRVQRLPRLQGIERRRRIARVVGERVRRQSWWQVVSHAPRLRNRPGIPPAVARHVAGNIKHKL